MSNKISAKSYLKVQFKEIRKSTNGLSIREIAEILRGVFKREEVKSLVNELIGELRSEVKLK